jgi:NAD(P)-dependent dehydrogenase (short-subunit alcohol dehydrogenase family)
VLLADRNTEAVHRVTAEIDRDSAIFTEVDVAVGPSVAAMIETVVRTWGRLDLAVNNAGIAQPAMPLDQVTEEQFDQLMGVNAKGVWLCMKYEIPAMLSSSGGAIVNVTSVASHIAAQGQGAYAGSKHAALGLTKGAALDYAARGIRVSAVSPALVDTPMARNFVAASRDPNVLEPIKAAHPSVGPPRRRRSPRRSRGSFPTSRASPPGTPSWSTVGTRHSSPGRWRRVPPDSWEDRHDRHGPRSRPDLPGGLGDRSRLPEQSAVR